MKRPRGFSAESESGRGPGLASLRSDLNWSRLIGSATSAPRPALFLDRDGVVVVERHYLSDPAGVELIPGAAATIRTARSDGAAVVVVTNQSGIGRGYFDWSAYAAVEERMLELLAGEGASLDMILACPFHPAGRPPYARDDAWRKPRAGMLLEAQTALNLDLDRSLLVGDRASDVEAARNAGLRRSAITLTGYGADEVAAAMRLARTDFEVLSAGSIADVRV